MSSLYKSLPIRKHAVLYTLLAVMMLLNVKASAQWAISGPTHLKPGVEYTFTPTFNGSSDVPYCGSYNYMIWGGLFGVNGPNEIYGYIDCSTGQKTLKDIAVNNVVLGDNTGSLYFFDENWNELASTPLIKEDGYTLNGPTQIRPDNKYYYTTLFNGASDHPFCGEYYFVVTGGYIDNVGQDSKSLSIDCASGTGTLNEATVEVTWTSTSGTLELRDQDWNLIASTFVTIDGYWFEGEQYIIPGETYTYYPTFNGTADQSYCGSYRYTISGGWEVNTGMSVISGNTSCNIAPQKLSDIPIDIVWDGSFGELKFYDKSDQLVATYTVYEGGTNHPGYLQDNNTTIYSGAVAPTIVGSIASGIQCYRFLWEKKTDSGNWIRIPGAVGRNCNPGILYERTEFRRRVDYCDGSQIENHYTNSIYINVLPPLSLSIGPESQFVDPGEKAAILTATVGGGNGIFACQWQSSPDNINWTNVGFDLRNNIYFEPGILNAKMYYRAIVTSYAASNVVSLISNVAVVNICPPVTSITGSSTCIKGSTLKLANSTPGGSWSSSNPSVAKVDVNGLVTGMAVGAATISYNLVNTCASSTAQLTINVLPFEDVLVRLGKGIDDPLKTGVITLAKDAVNTLGYDQDGGQSLAHTIKNVLALRVIEEPGIYIPGDFSAEVLLKVEYGHSSDPGSICQLENELKLLVNYAKDGGAKYDALNYFTFENAEFTRVTVLDVIAPQTVNGVAFDTKQVLELTNTLAGTRYYKLADNKKPDITDLIAGPGAVPDAVKVKWKVPANTFNNAVQLEWAWVEDRLDDDYKDANGKIIYDLVFKAGATRIDLPGNDISGEYDIPLLFDGEGKLHVRVRAVNFMPSGSRSDGPWSNEKSFDFHGHEENLNWQATTSFAEEGKRKTIVQYYDGSLRQRQTVTKDNTTGQTVVAETMYDMEGRPAVQILPAPGINNIIAYSKNLNKFNNQPDNTNPADYFDFSVSSLGNYATTPLDENHGGTAKYYSPKNPEASTGIHKNIPQSNGYPYTVTRYTPDGTGRIMRQSAPGDSHKMGSDHETKYFYGEAAQEELDPLFGTEVGDETHYFKNMVQDANGQMSVSYLDMQGRTIATALAGEITNLEALASNDAAKFKEIDRNLLSKESNILKGNSIESINTIMVPGNNTRYDFTYSLSKQTLTLPTCNGGTVTYDCKFDLEISITDESGDKDPVVYTYPAIDNLSITKSELLNAGSYSVRKTLTINQQWLQDLLEQYNADGVGVCKTKQELIDDITALDIKDSECGKPIIPVTSSGCMATLGTIDVYVSNYATSIGRTVTELTAQQLKDVKSQYDAAAAFCASLDPDRSQTLETIRKQMLTDMIPFTGQYAKKEKDNNDAGMFNKYNIFSEEKVVPAQPFYKSPKYETSGDGNYYNDFGSVDGSITIANLNRMSKEEFEQAFKEPWAKSLLTYHPEYSKLAFAEKELSKSYDFIDKFQLTTAPYDAIGADPFFSRPDQVEEKTEMGKFSNESWPAANGYSMWQMAYADAFGCKTMLNDRRTVCYENMPKGFAATGTVWFTGMANVALTDDMQSKAWAVYKSLYTTARNEMVNRYINEGDRGVDNTALIQEGNLLHFPKDNVETATNNAGASDSDEWESMIPGADGKYPPVNYNAAAAQYAHPCDSYINAWRKALLECQALLAKEETVREGILNSIISKMQEICRKGTDDANRYGSSTVAPAYAGDDITSFEEAVTTILGNNGITPDQFCHPYGIEWPKQYGQNPRFAKQYAASVEQCNCDQWNKLKAEIGSAAGSLAGVNQYLSSRNQETITAELYAGLLKCGQSYTSCNYPNDPNPCVECRVELPTNPACTTIYSIPLPTPQPLPAVLTCGYDNSSIKCYRCEDFITLKDEFKGIFGKEPVFYGTVPDDIVEWNDLFAKFVNYRTGLQHNWIYYATQFNKTGCVIGGIKENAGNGEDLSVCLDQKPINDASGFIPPSPCDVVRTRAIVKATLRYEYLQQQALAKFRTAYQEKCLAATEDFKVKYTVKEYHYTLYYYDRAGNLVKTVPPKGVQPNYDASFLSEVKAERVKMASGLPYTPKPVIHSLETRYIYNSLNKIVVQKTPDAGVSRFWYDVVGRPVVGQDAKQAARGNVYSFTYYDYLGRVTLTSELTGSVPITDVIAKDYESLSNWYNEENTNYSQTQMVFTSYDVGYGGVVDGYAFAQNNLRNRVAYRQRINHQSDGTHASGTYYSYDVHGNVDAVLQDFGNSDYVPNFMNQTGNRFKKIVYDYDLISGKVNQLSYQPGEPDAYYHRYEYDGENRLMNVLSGRDEVMLKLFPEREARYDYFKHGPLASATLGKLMVQKQDYAYTLQGWLKGVNPAFGGTLANGINTTEASPVAQDAYGFSLHYFDNDYKAIGYTPQSPTVLGSLGSSTVSLYNGNIAAMAVNIPKLGANKVYNYHYDQLNRIVAMDAYNGLDVSTGTFTPGSSLVEYKERISYDPNGNILKYLRNGDAARQSMDDLTYHYKTENNQLHKVTDAAADVPDADYSKYNDIKQGQADNSYVYDAAGNVIKDNAAGIDITWTSFGKIASINKSGVVTNFVYDADGNRILKENPSGSTAYVRDGSGNVLSVYSKVVDASNEIHASQSEVHLYGSQRLGIVASNRVADALAVLGCGFGTGRSRTFTRGEKLFELNNHLGNVLATVTDKRIAVPVSGSSTSIDHYEADVASAQDYYSFGMSMPGRSVDADSYRYGFNGQEKDDEIKGSANSYDFEFRMYDPRLGKFLSVDPLVRQYPMLTPYQFASNRPIDGIDMEGTEWKSQSKWSDKITNKAHIKALGASYKNGMTYSRAWSIMAPKLLKSHENEIFDCANLSITVMVEYAYKFNLPVYFKDYKAENADPTFSNDDYKYNDKKGKSIEFKEGDWKAFADAIAGQYGAADLYNNSNITVEKGFGSLKAGDLVGWKYQGDLAGHFHSQTVSEVGDSDGLFDWDDVNDYYVSIQGSLSNGQPVPAFKRKYDIEDVKENGNGTGATTKALRWNTGYFDSHMPEKKPVAKPKAKATTKPAAKPKSKRK